MNKTSAIINNGIESLILIRNGYMQNNENNIPLPTTTNHHSLGQRKTPFSAIK
jgi:hypothetical protein